MHIQRRNLLGVTLLVLLTVGVTLGSIPAAYAQGLNLVYTQSNDVTSNAVYGYSNDNQGNLTPLPGSPYLTGGVGVANDGPDDRQFDADGQVMINQAGTILFAVNGHTNTVSVFTINQNGSLTPVAGSPFASNGQEPASVAVRDNAIATGTGLAIVVNKASDPDQNLTGTPNYTSFDYDSAGVMTMNPGSEFDLAAGGSTSQALFTNKSGNTFFGIEFMTGLIGSYRVTKAGIMSNIVSVTPPNVFNPATLGAVLHPTLPELYVALPLSRLLTVWTYDGSGNLTWDYTAPNDGGAICWLAINKAGNRVYSAETNSGTISVYSTKNPKKAVELQHYTIPETGSVPAHVAIDPTGKFLYALDRLGTLHVISILSDGTLSETIAPVSLGISSADVPLGLAVLRK